MSVGYVPSCAAVQPATGYLCTRPTGHEGQHTATAGRHGIVARWGRKTAKS